MTVHWSKWEGWAFVSPPSRPSAAQIKFASKCLRKIPRRAPVCVLGSTVEYRVLLHNLGFQEIVVIDRSEPFKAWTDHFLPPMQLAKERFIAKDWLEALKERRGAFGAILSDLTLGNIAFDAQITFLESVKQSLSPGGYFLDKLLHLSGARCKIRSLDNYYAYQPICIATANDFNCRALFTSELIEELDCVDSTAFYQQLSHTLHSVSTIAILNLCREFITPEGNRWHYGRRTKQLFTEYKRIFNVRTAYSEPRTSPYFANCDFLCST